MKLLKPEFHIRIFTVVLIIAGLVLIILGFYDFQSQQTIKNMQTRYDEIYKIRNEIIRDDDLVTMSARTAAVTGDIKWEKRFNKYAAALAGAIHQAIALSPGTYRQQIGQGAFHTIKTFEMEHQAFVFIHQGKTRQAMEILFGKEYDEEREAYTGTIVRLNAFIDNQLKAALIAERNKHELNVMAFITVLCLLLLSWLVIVRMGREIKEELLLLLKETKKKNEQLHAANYKLENLYNIQKEFSSTVSHELRTPLSAIKAAIDIVISGIAGDITEQQKDFLGRAKSNVDRLNRLINGILDLAHLESGKITMKKEPRDINQIIPPIVKALGSVANAKGLYLRASLQQPMPLLYLDEDKIIEVMDNFINNAIKFTQAGGIEVFSCLNKEKAQVEVRIQDTGCGIEKQDLTKLFEKFQQLGEAHQRQAGTGLGLAICKEIIRQHGGHVGVQSTSGQGSCFYFVLPLQGAPPPAIGGERRDAKGDGVC